MTDKGNIVVSVIMFLIAIGIIGTTFTSCSASRAIHYGLAQDCIKAGGSWIDMTDANSYKGTCVNGYRNPQQ